MLPNICISSRDFERIETLLDSLPVAYSAIKERLQEEMVRRGERDRAIGVDQA